MPQDGGAWFTINWLSPSGRLNRQRAFQLDEMETVLRLTAGQANVYMSQCLLDRPVRRSPFVAYAQMMLGRYLARNLAGEQDIEAARHGTERAVAQGLQEAKADLAALPPAPDQNPEHHGAPASEETAAAPVFWTVG
jgi:hypothetical protein